MQHAVLFHLASLRVESRRAIDELSTVVPTEVLAMATVAEILETVEHTPGCVGLLPVEDSFEGEHTSVLDALVFETSSVFVCEEIVVAETFDAFVSAGDREGELRTAVSHPKAIEHCRRFIRERGLATRLVGSTEEACRTVAESGDNSLVAIAPEAAAERWGLMRLRTAVGDVPDARTRFFVVGRSVGRRSGRDKTTLVLTQARDRSGNLERYLRAFSDNDVNLVSLHSRPMVPAAGSYCFLATAEAHVLEPRMAAVIEALWAAGAQVKLLGSYPEWEGEQVVAPFDQSPLASVGPTSPDADRAALLAPSVVEPGPVAPAAGCEARPVAVVEYLGPEGTFAHAGTDRLRTVAAGAEFVARATVSDIVHDVDQGRCDYGLVPLENSIEGGVTATIDVLVFEVDRVRIREEVVVPVTFVAFRRPDDLEGPAAVALSHPFGLAQCKRYVADHGLRVESTQSTADACRLVAESAEPGRVAIASAKAGALVGLTPVAQGIEDFPGASTRFALVAREGVGPTGDDKTTMVLTPSSERAGVLLRLLHPFADRGISLTEIVSRPVRQQLGVYHFLVTVDHHGDHPELRAAVAELEADGATVKLLGSYPAWRNGS